MDAVLASVAVWPVLTGQSPLAHNTSNCRTLLRREQEVAVSEPDFYCRDSPASNREVAMSEKADIRIDIEAAKALVYWKSLFADEVAARARRLAAESSQPGHVTLAHYRQAAQLAVRSLPVVIRDGEPFSDDHKVA
jgi:hypothetical protein